MCGDKGSTRQRYVILSFRIMDSTGTEHCFRSFLFIIRRWIQITFSSFTVPQWPFGNVPSLACLLIPRSAISTLGHIKPPSVLTRVQLSSLPPLCPPPLAGSLPIHLRNPFLQLIPAVHTRLPFSLPQQTNRSGSVRTPPTRPSSNRNNTHTQPTGKHLRSTYKPAGLLLAPNQGPRVQMIQRSQRQFQPCANCRLSP